MTESKHQKKDPRHAKASAPARPTGGDGGPAEEAGTTAEAAAAPELLDLARLQAERDEYVDHLQRLKAEFENYRKRVQRDNEALMLRAGEGVIESLLPVVDNMQRALEAAQRHEEGQLIEGVERVAHQLRAVLESHGLEEVPTEPGMPFDPTVHEAVLTQASEYPEGCIVAVLERGFLLHGRLLRPAKVIVAQ